MGDIFSWGIFSLLISFLSLLEERSLMREFNEDFSNYFSQTGFYLPINRHISKKELRTFNFYKGGTWLLTCFITFNILFPFLVQCQTNHFILLKWWNIFSSSKFQFFEISSKFQSFSASKFQFFYKILFCRQF
jgi:hypothetical protein